MTYCEICENRDKEKRSGVCMTCINNTTYTNHLKVSKQVSAIMVEFGITLDDIVKGKTKE